MAVREILFRGKRADIGKWVYGYFMKDRIGRYMIIDELEEIYNVDPETVGQWTGLVDKNGVKIFEDDVIKCSILYDIGCYPHTCIETRVVTYKDGRFNPLYYCERNNVEVIGNIWDNPELVKSVSE